MPPIRRRRGLSCSIAWVLVTLACQSTMPLREPPARTPPPYRPGQSIAESRLCECRECFDSACCGGDPDRERATPAFGLAVASCGRCLKRVWTVRGNESCESLRPPECCAGTSSG